MRSRDVVRAIRQSRAGPPAAADVVVAFNEAAMMLLAGVTLTIV